VKLAVAALAAFLILAAPARASFTVTPASPQAGGHADLTIHSDFAQTPARVALHLPPGLIGNPSAADRCPRQTFETGTCPASSRVGQASATATLLGLPVPASGGVFNLEPAAGEPARLGIVLGPVNLPVVRNEASVSLRPDGGLDSTIPQLETGGLGLQSLDLTLDASFIRFPTSCVPATVTMEADATYSASFTPTGCQNVPFNPGLAAQLDTIQRAAPSGAKVTLTLPPGQSDVRRAQIALPVGTTLNPGVADGLQAGTAAQFAGAGCPAGSQVGTVSFDTPLLGTLPGKVYFGDGFRLYVVVEGSGVRVALAGDVRLDPATGQITTVFDNLPQVPFSAFALSFQGGPHAVLANPASCGPHTVTALLTPWSGTAAKTATATFTIGTSAPGVSCSALPLAPALAATAQSTAAGRPAGAVTLAISRPDGTQDFSRVTTHMPPGLAGSLKGVPTCPDANADAGTCPAASRVGSVSTLVGSGSAPVALAGTVFLTGPTDGGPAGLAIALPAQVGPVNLGTAVVRASIALRPDGGLDVRTRPLPRFLGGVPVSIRSLALTLDRPGFVLNASSCALQQVSATVDGVDGGSATATAPYQATDCAHLPFAPHLRATVGARGKTHRSAAAPLHVVVTVPAGQAATAQAQVALPPSLGLSLAGLGRACTGAAYAAGTCPKTALIGRAVATTPLLPGRLTSPVMFVTPRPGALPGLALNFTGPVTLPLFGDVQLPTRDKRIKNTFSGIPDVPLGRFDLKFSSASPLQLRSDACRGKRRHALATLTAHSGAVAHLKAPLKVAGCPPVVKLRKGRIHVTRGRDGAKLRKITLRGHRVRSGQRVRLRRHHTYRLTVKDAAHRTWHLKVRR
jgi:hypothetical protein